MRSIILTIITIIVAALTFLLLGKVSHKHANDAKKYTQPVDKACEIRRAL